MSSASMASLHDNVLAPFHLLDIEPRFALDQAALKEKLLALQCQHHPDRFVGDAAKQQQAEALFSRLTWAAEQLQNSKTRAKLLFQAQGLWPVPHETTVLAELMELEEDFSEGTVKREALAEKERAATETLATQLDAGDFQAAGTTFMWWNGLRRLLNASSHTAPVPQQPGPLS